jgi:hypothetical protein
LLLVATIRLRTLPLLGWLAPVLRAQVMREANARRWRASATSNTVTSPPAGLAATMAA